MTTYTAIASTEIDADSPITTGLMNKLRDNPIAITEGASGAPQIQTAAIATAAVTNAKIAVDAITQDEIADDAVGNAQLGNSSVGSGELASGAVKQAAISKSTSDTNNITSTTTITPAGGVYGLGFEFYEDSGTFNCDAHYGDSDATSSFNAAVKYTVGSGQGDVREHYIAASPPYKFGNIDIPWFNYVLLDKDNKPIISSSCQDPVWAYNGPYKCKADVYRKKNGKVISCIYEREDSRELVELKKRDLKEYFQERRKTKFVEKELTYSMKNRNMQYFSSPFRPKPQEKVVLVAPDDEIMQFLIDLHDEPGVHIIKLLKNNYLKFDKGVSLDESPPGVEIMKIKFK